METFIAIAPQNSAPDIVWNSPIMRWRLMQILKDKYL